MQYLKFGKLAALAAFSLSLAACAELTNGLQAVNATLAGINSGTDSSGTTPNTIAMPDKVTSQYEVRNLKLTQETVSDLTSVHFNGQAYNKTKKSLRITIKVPVYDPKGYHAGDVRSEFTIPPKERIRIDTSEPYTINLSKGEKMNTAKATYRVDVF
jgi:lipoprotein